MQALQGDVGAARRQADPVPAVREGPLMGREVRRVPPDWEHPRHTKETTTNPKTIGHYIPLHDEDYETARRDAFTHRPTIGARCIRMRNSPTPMCSASATSVIVVWFRK